MEASWLHIYSLVCHRKLNLCSVCKALFPWAAVGVVGIPAPALLPSAAIAAGQQTPAQPSPHPASTTMVSWGSSVDGES